MRMHFLLDRTCNKNPFGIITKGCHNLGYIVIKTSNRKGFFPRERVDPVCPEHLKDYHVSVMTPAPHYEYI